MSPLLLLLMPRLLWIWPQLAVAATLAPPPPSTTPTPTIPSSSSSSSSASSFGISAAHPLLPELLTVNGNATKTERPADACGRMHLTGRQRRLCRQDSGLAETLLEAVRLSATFCRHQFRYERWDCPIDDDFGRIQLLRKVTRETAALYAFSAAGVTHGVARACAAGRLRDCHCAEASNAVETRQTWKWGGCGDNLSHGRAFAAKFLDAGPTRPESRWKRTMATNVAATRKMSKPPKKNSGKKFGTKHGGRKSGNVSANRQRIDRNNNAVGVQVVEQLVNRTCKCHGVSGSCTMQTCWNQLASFGDTARALRARYETAARLATEISENSSHLRKVALGPGDAKKQSRHWADAKSQVGHAKKSAKKTSTELSVGRSENDLKLLYLDDSPDFCQADTGSERRGTAGRVCLRGANCDVLCCGRGYHVHETVVTVPCKCKLVLCCQVECQNCLVEKRVETCK